MANALNIYLGKKLHMVHYQNLIEFVAVKDMKKMRGFLKGIDTVIKRDSDRLLKKSN